MPLFLSMYLFSLLGPIVHLRYLPAEQRTFHRCVELFLLYQLIFSVGITSLLAFIGLTFMPVYVALFSGWPVCPFEQDLGNVNLAFGILGILCIWYRGLFWKATILGFSIWIFSDGLHHIYDILYNKNYAPGSVGVSLITDLAVPPILVALLWLLSKSE